MSTVLGFSTDLATDDLLAERVVAKAIQIGAADVVIVAHGGMPVTTGHGLGPRFLPGESGHEAEDRAEAMCAIARARGLKATPLAAVGPDGACIESACEQHHPDAVVVATAKHRLVGDLLDAEAVHAAKRMCGDVEAVHD